MPTVLDLIAKNQMLSESIDLLHKSSNAPVPYPTMHQFITEMCTILLQNHALWVISLVHSGICEKELIHNFSLSQLLPIKNHRQRLTALLDSINGSDW